MIESLPPMEFMNPPDLRLDALRRWISRDLARPMASIEVASADASFRRYFRVNEASGATLIAMDAPPDKEDIRPYLSVAQVLEKERATGGPEFWFGDRLTHADIGLATALRFINEAHPGLLPMGELGHLLQHALRMEAMPVFQAVCQPFNPPA